MNRWVTIFVIGIFLMVACRTPNQRSLTQLDLAKADLTATSTPYSTVTPPPVHFSDNEALAVDCGYHAIGKAWLDANANGIWDEAETPLGGIHFFIDDVYNEIRQANGDAITDQNGEALIFVFLPGCPKVEFELYALAEEPQYQLTTEARIQVDERDLEEVYLFGFVIDETSIPPPPSIPALACERLYHFQSIGEPFRFYNDVLWFTGVRGGIDRFSEDGFESVGDHQMGYSSHFTVDAEGNLWVATLNGVEFYDGKRWRLFDIDDGLPDDFAADIEMAQDGLIWAISEELAWYDSATERWHLYANQETPIDTESYPEFIRLPSGALWISTNEKLYRYQPSETDNPKWKLMSDFMAEPALMDYVYQTKGFSETEFWMRGSMNDMDTLGYIELSSNTHYAFNYETTNGEMPNDHLEGYAIDASNRAWVGFELKGLYQLTIDETGEGQWQHFALQHGTEIYVSDPIEIVGINPIAVDSSGHLWVTSGKGLSRCVLPSPE